MIVKVFDVGIVVAVAHFHAWHSLLQQAPGLRPQKVLTEQAVAKRRGWIPWAVAGGLLGAAAAAWHFGLLQFV